MKMFCIYVLFCLSSMVALVARTECELYHLGNDSYELENEIGNPECRAVFEELKRQWHVRLDELGDADPIVTEKSLVKTKHANLEKRKNEQPNV